MSRELTYSDEAATEYDRAFAHVSEHFVPFLLRAARVAPGMHVLDVATGTGLAAAAAYLATTFKDGFDPARAAMIALAETLPPQELERVAFRLYECFGRDSRGRSRLGKVGGSWTWRARALRPPSPLLRLCGPTLVT